VQYTALQLAEQGGYGVLFVLVGGAEVIEEDQAEAAQRLDKLQGEAAIAAGELHPIDPFALAGFALGVGRFRGISRLVVATVLGCSASATKRASGSRGVARRQSCAQAAVSQSQP